MEEVRVFMAIRYKVDIMAKTQRKRVFLYQNPGRKVDWAILFTAITTRGIGIVENFDTICTLLDCQPGDLLEYVRKPQATGNLWELRKTTNVDYSSTKNPAQREK